MLTCIRRTDTQDDRVMLSEETGDNGQLVQGNSLVIYPRTTWSQRNKDVIDLITSAAFQQKVGIDLRYGRHALLNVGVGAIPFDTIELSHALKGLGNDQLSLIATELPDAWPLAYLHLTDFLSGAANRQIICDALSKFMKGTGIQNPDPDDVFLVVNKDFKFTDAIVGFRGSGSGRQIYMTIAVSPDVKYVSFKGASIGETHGYPILFERMMDYLRARGLNFSQGGLKSVIEKESANIEGINIEHDPIGSRLAELHPKVKFVLTGNLAAKGIKEQDVIMANHVTTHFSDADERKFIDDMREALKEGGVLVIKNRKDNPLTEIVIVYKKIIDRMVIIEQLTIHYDKIGEILASSLKPSEFLVTE